MVSEDGRRQGQQAVGLAIGGGLALATLSSVILAMAHPLPAAHNYWLAVHLCVWLAVIWATWLLRPDLVRRPGVLLAVLVAGLAVGAGGLLTVDRDSEIVHVYDSVFEAIDRGENPYTADTVYHRDGEGDVVTGSFNYPPLELVAPYVASKVAGHWDAGVLTGLLVGINVLAGMALLAAFRRHVLWVLPWIPLIVFFDVKSNVSMTLLLTVLVLWAMKAGGADPGPGRRVLVAVLFGVALTTKFLVIPLFAAYAWHELANRGRHPVRRVEADVAIATVTALALVAPFGVLPVLRSTLGFNLALGERQQLTTFYPNALSGFCEWLGVPGLYGALAVTLLVAAVLVAPRLDVGLAMVFAVTTFLLVAPTPEPQYLPVVLCLVLALTWWRWEDEEAVALEAIGGRGPAARAAGPATA